MLTIYQTTTEGKLERVSEMGKNSWIQLVSPTSAEIDHVAEVLNIPKDFLTDPLDLEERPRIEQRDEFILMVLHLPFEQLDVTNLYDNVKYRTIPLGIVHAKDHFIMICGEETPFIQNFVSRRAALASHMKTRNTIDVINEASHAYIQMLEVIEQAISVAETELSKSYRNRELYTLLYLNESLLYIAASLKQMNYTMQKIEHGHYMKLYEEDAELLDDARIELEQAREVAEISQSNLNNIMDAYGNVIQNNVNRVLKFLAAITIILSIPTLIASIYGMNVPLPFQEKPNAFAVLIVVMVAMSGLFTYIFYKKRYF